MPTSTSTSRRVPKNPRASCVRRDSSASRATTTASSSRTSTSSRCELLCAARHCGKLVMKIIIPGGTGHVGTLLARAFHGGGHEVVVLSRQPRNSPWRSVAWDGEKRGALAAELEGADAVINLAGPSVNCRYSAVNRRAILHSRVNSTRAVGAAIARAARPPRVWLQRSTPTIYAHRY